jgi:hypothetical protein
VLIRLCEPDLATLAMTLINKGVVTGVDGCFAAPSPRRNDMQPSGVSQTVHLTRGRPDPGAGTGSAPWNKLPPGELNEKDPFSGR